MIFIPILAPLADFMHITRQVTVQAVMLGEGVVNCLNPTSGVLMGVLAASGISYGKWIRFMAPLAFIWFIIGLIFLIVGVNIEWGRIKTMELSPIISPLSYNNEKRIDYSNQSFSLASLKAKSLQLINCTHCQKKHGFYGHQIHLRHCIRNIYHFP